MLLIAENPLPVGLGCLAPQMFTVFFSTFVGLQDDKTLPPPKLNTAPAKWWLEADPFLLGFGNFSAANC